MWLNLIDKPRIHQLSFFTLKKQVLRLKSTYKYSFSMT